MQFFGQGLVRIASSFVKLCKFWQILSNLSNFVNPCQFLSNFVKLPFNAEFLRSQDLSLKKTALHQFQKPDRHHWPAPFITVHALKTIANADVSDTASNISIWYSIWFERKKKKRNLHCDHAIYSHFLQSRRHRLFWIQSHCVNNLNEKCTASWVIKLCM